MALVPAASTALVTVGAGSGFSAGAGGAAAGTAATGLMATVAAIPGTFALGYTCAKRRRLNSIEDQVERMQGEIHTLRNQTELSRAQIEQAAQEVSNVREDMVAMASSHQDQVMGMQAEIDALRNRATQMAQQTEQNTAQIEQATQAVSNVRDDMVALTTQSDENHEGLVRVQELTAQNTQGLVTLREHTNGLARVFATTLQGQLNRVVDSVNYSLKNNFLGLFAPTVDRVTIQPPGPLAGAPPQALPVAATA